MASNEPTPLRLKLDRLIALQEIDSARDRATRARAQLTNISRFEVAAETAAQQEETARRRAAESQADLKDAELQLEGIEAKIKSYEQRQRSGQITNARDVSNVEREINQLVRQRAVLDDKILHMMDDVDSSKVAAVEAQNRSREAAQEFATQRALQRAGLDRLDAELNRLSSERSGAVAAIDDAQLLQRYEALRAKPSAGGLAVAKIEAMHCSGCHTQISTIDADRVRNVDGIVTCETCSRILAAIE